MGQGQSLVFPEKVDRVLSCDRAAAEREDADLILTAFAADAFAPVHHLRLSRRVQIL